MHPLFSYPTLPPLLITTPTGPAGGDLTGTYPDPQIADGAVTTETIANGAVTDLKIAGISWAKIINPPTGLPPTGPASGVLTGTYPAPGLATEVVGPANLTQAARDRFTPVPTIPADQGKVLTVDTSGYAQWMLPTVSAVPTGPAGGDLTGSYPDPTIGAGKVTRAKTASDLWLSPIPTGADVTKVLTVAAGPVLAWQTPTGGGGGAALYVGPDPPPAPTPGQLWWRNDPDGNLYVYYNDGTSSQFVPAMSSVGKLSGPAGGDLLGSYPNPTVVKAQAGFVVGASLMTVDATGKLTLPGPTAGADQAALKLGTRTVKGRLMSLPTFDYVALSTNLMFDGAAWQRDDTALHGWRLVLYEAGDAFNIERVSAANVATTLLTQNNAGDLGIAGAIATKASGTTWANPSDRRLKKNIQPYITGLAAIQQLAPVSFQFNGKGGSQDGMQGYGFLADEVAPVMPEMVGSRRGKLDDADEEETDIQTLDTSNLTPALVNAVKELDARLRALEAR